MSVRSGVEARLAAAGTERAGAQLPKRMRAERGSVRVLMLQRLAIQQAGVKAGGSAGLRSAKGARPFRVDVRQRVVVKALVSRHTGLVRGGALSKHVSYLQRAGAGVEGERAEFYGRGAEGAGADGIATDAVNVQAVTRAWAQDRHHFRFIVSPEHGDRIGDMSAYVREVMGRVADDLGEPKLQWLAANHFDTDQPHAHVLVRGRREDGRDLVIPRQYMGYGFRARAQEVAHELLGELSRDQGEQRLWRDTRADQLTRFDRALLDSQAQNGGVGPDGAGKQGTYAALLRGRLAHLEKLGLAKRVRGGALLHPQLEAELKALQLRRDVIRTLNERRLAGAERVQEIGSEPVHGTVVKAGFHDELGAQGYVVVRDGAGLEHYARLRLGQPVPEIGREVTTQGGELGRAQVRGARLGRER